MINRRSLFRLAWDNAKAAHQLWGGSLRGRFASCLRHAWTALKAKAARVPVAPIKAPPSDLSPAFRAALARQEARHRSPYGRGSYASRYVSCW